MKLYPRLTKMVLGFSMAGFAMLAGQGAWAGAWGSPTMGDSMTQDGWGATVEANALDPRGLGPVNPDPNGLGPYRVPVAHTPTGQMYSVPWEDPDPTKTLTGSIEVGGIYTSGDNNKSTGGSALFNNYKDMSNGIFINHFDFAANSGNSFLNISGGGVGREDGYYNLQAGEYNAWKIRGFYSEVPHVYSDTMQSIYTGVGTNRLDLVPSLAYLGSVQTVQASAVAAGTASCLNASGCNTVGSYHSVQQTVANTPYQVQEQLRQKGGLRFDMNLADNWSIFGSYSLERRTGSMPYGLSGGGFPGATSATAINSPTGIAGPICTNQQCATGAVGATTGFVSAYGNGQPIEAPYPIDFLTHEFQAGAGWADDLDSLNIRAHVSLFNDANNQVVWQNPFVSPSNIENRNYQNFTTFPSNQEGGVQVDYQRLFPTLWNAAWNVTTSVGQQRQDQSLVPGTVVTGYSAAGDAASPNGTGVNFNYWNSNYVNVTTGQPCASASQPNCMPTLSRENADLHNNIFLFSTGLTLHPIDRLGVNAKWRWYDQDNSNTYVAYNPACAANPGINAGNTTGVGCGTGAYGYLYEDDSGTSTGSSVGAGTPGGVQSVINAAGGIATNNGANDTGFRVQSFNTSWRMIDTDLGADYRISNKDSATFNFEREDTNRSDRERAWTFENKYKLTFVSKDVPGGTLRLSAEDDNRTGTPYNNSYNVISAVCADAALNQSNQSLCMPPLYNSAGVYQGNVVVGNGGAYPASGGAGTLDPSILGTKYDLADRDQYVLIGRFNYMLTSNLDGMITARDQIQRYPSDPYGYGREFRDDTSLTAELNWQISTVTNAYLYDTWQVMSQDQSDAGAGGSSCTYALLDAGECNDVPGGSVTPNIQGSHFAGITDMFRYTMGDNNNMIGAGFSHLFESKQKFDLTYQYEVTHSSIGYANYVPGNCHGAPAPVLGLNSGYYGCPNVISATYTAGVGLYPNAVQFPDEVFDRQTLGMNYTIPLTKMMAVRLSYTWDHAVEADWHYDGLCSNYFSTPGSRYYLSCNPQSGFQDQTFGAFLQWKL